MVIVAKIKPGENLTGEIFYRRKIPNLRYCLLFSRYFWVLVSALRHCLIFIMGIIHIYWNIKLMFAELVLIAIIWHPAPFSLSLVLSLVLSPPPLSPRFSFTSERARQLTML